MKTYLVINEVPRHQDIYCA